MLRPGYSYFFPVYLILIASFIIIASRYSTRVLRWIYTRSLPALFLLSYTGTLRAISTVLFSYSTITELPSDHQQLVWSVDASVPLFGLKFTILFITCLVLFLLLVPFNIILLFTRYQLRFKVVYRFVPLLDAFQGSYKIRHQYWSAIYIIVRNLLFAVTAISYIQELILLVNLTILYMAAAVFDNIAFFIIANIMIGCALLQCCISMHIASLVHFYIS